MQHTHVSLVKFCEVTFGLRALNQRDTASDGMEDCFDFTKPADPTPPQTGAAPVKTAPKKRPARKPAAKKRPVRKAARRRR